MRRSARSASAARTPGAGRSPPGAASQQPSRSPVERRACASAIRMRSWAARSVSGSSRSAASSQCAAVAGARGAVAAAASSRTAIASASPARALLDVVRALRRAAPRAPAPRRRGRGERPPAPPLDSYTARRTSGCRNAKRRGTAVGCRSRASSSSSRRRRRRRRVELCDREREVGLERISGDGRGVEQRARRRADAPELVHSAAATARGTPVWPPCGVSPGSAARRRSGGELQRVERVAPALAEDLGVPRLRQAVAGQRSALLLPQRLQRDERHLPGGERGHERRGRPAGPMAEGEQHARRHAAAHERADEVRGGGVAPVEVVEDEHDGLVLRQEAEQVPHRRCARWRSSPTPASPDVRSAGSTEPAPVQRLR